MTSSSSPSASREETLGPGGPVAAPLENLRLFRTRYGPVALDGDRVPPPAVLGGMEDIGEVTGDCRTPILGKGDDPVGEVGEVAGDLMRFEDEV